MRITSKAPATRRALEAESTVTQDLGTDEVVETVVGGLKTEFGKELIMKHGIVHYLTVIGIGLFHLGGLRFLFVGKGLGLRITTDIAKARTRVGTDMTTGFVAKDFAMKTGENGRGNCFHNGME